MGAMWGIMIQTAVLVTAILAVRKLLGEKLHAYIRYGLWLLVALRLLIPVNFMDSPVSVLRLADIVAGRYAETSSVKGEQNSYLGSIGSSPMELQEKSPLQENEGAAGRLQAVGEKAAADRQQTEIENTAADRLQTDGESAVTGRPQTAGEKAVTDGLQTDGESAVAGEENIAVEDAHQTAVDSVTQRKGSISATAIFRRVWLAGSLLVGGTLFTAYYRFRRRLYRTRQLCHGSRTPGVTNGRRARKAYRSLPVYRTDQLEAPCLVGVLHPAVYIGTDMKTDTDRFRQVVIHEQVHYLHGDHIWALLRAVLVTVYWFHPFVWIAAAASARDGEIACDHGTIRQLGDAQRLTYGETLLDLSRKNHGKRIYSYGTMLRPGSSELKERITRLAGGNGTRLSAGILAAVLMLVMAGCAFTGASREDGNTEAAGVGEAAGSDTSQEIAGASGSDTRQESEKAVGNDASKEPGETGSDALQGTEKYGPERGSTDLDAEGNMPAGEADFDPEEEITETRQLVAKEAAISGETELGVDGPTLDYAGPSGLADQNSTNSNVIIFHDYFGLIVYDLTDREIVRSLDLAAIGCQFTQEDNACQVAVSGDGRSIWLHPRRMRYMFRYDVDRNLLWQLPIVKSFEVDLETEDLFDRYLVTEEQYIGWRSNYLYEEYKDESGLQTAYIYLYASPSDGEPARMRNLQCVWDDMVYILWDVNTAGVTGSALSDRDAGEFPYVSDGAAADILLTYREPCVYDRISDTFGERVHPATGEVRVHEGIDYAAAAGTDITAAADGIVYETGFSAKYGNYVVLLHPNGDMTYYCHCQDIMVSEEEQVNGKDRIATVGSSGRATGAHLHFALSRNGVFVDPLEQMNLSAADPAGRWKDVQDAVRDIEDEFAAMRERAGMNR